MGPIEVLKLEIEREEKGLIMMEFQRMAESSGEIPSPIFLSDKLRRSLEFTGSFSLGFFLGTFSLFVLYAVINIMK